MTAHTDWQRYAQRCADNSLVALTVERDADNAADIAALSLLEKREAIIDRQETAAFIADCTGWDEVYNRYDNPEGALVTVTNTDRFNAGYGVVVTMSAAHWALWLAGYEVVEAVPQYILDALAQPY